MHDIVDIEPLPQAEPVKMVLSYNNINNRQKKAKNPSRISLKQKQTLVEAVAEKEKSKSLDLTEVDKTAPLDNYVDTQDKGSFLKKKIRARLNKHSH